MPRKVDSYDILLGFDPGCEPPSAKTDNKIVRRQINGETVVIDANTEYEDEDARELGETLLRMQKDLARRLDAIRRNKS